MSMERIISRLRHAGVIAIFRKLPPESLLPLTEAVFAGGVEAVEVTVESEGAYDGIRKIRKQFGDALLVGAGTVMTVKEVDDAIAAGADFLLSPHLDTELVTHALSLGRPMIPGVMTPTEIVQATRAGAEILKLFPASALGTSFLKDLLGPFKDKLFIPTGGITADNAADFITLGAVGVGMGSSLATNAEIAAKDWTAVTNRVQLAVERVRAAKARRG
ncbi:bifunctional 4-hydroxy-2-oxoglutarate aldolase/2-dehydro-3-deoxy-phosphogluconate aldolase [Alicyclobacillus curvatus]|jgi:2-dehydro-3-deoxyphosphogluconate aldolase / (4S)-4-hydroxy-2-oxoglutarate aldolase|nr:bifunctional 4-hydroxy-2-oxoglutarate aldolase/2-dehydro-3-deoxy-phosphogluconate aldolase [Alicyclobacillus curvatus]